MAPEVPVEKQLSSTPRAAWRVLRDVASAVVLAVFVIVFVYRPVKVEGTSMMPNLDDDERIFINQFTYRFGIDQIQRGDTIVFWYPWDRSKSYIKRVIGLPGDVVEIEDGDVYINHRKLDEPYLPEAYRDNSSMERRIVPPNEYFVLGDHRSSSNDSRVWGTVPRELIFGKAVFAYWPVDKMGRVN